MNHTFLKIEVSGRVQGVGYRYATAEKASQLNIKGTVQNLLNGNVLIFASGAEKDLTTFTQWCYHGPTAAEVHSVEVCEIDTFDTSSFTIKRKTK